MNGNKPVIGALKLSNPFVLAPLAGITDGAFRYMCKAEGAALTYTEMVSAKGLFYGNENTEELLTIKDEEGPVGIQLFGAEPAMLAYAARSLADRPNVLIDINMGCPVPKVVKNNEGSALLKNPGLAASIVRETAEAAGAGKPVTVKMRIGFGNEPVPGEIDPVNFAILMEQAGAAAIAVHGRTREQYYSGKADWNAIKRIKAAVSIPVIGNGDVFSGEDAIRMLDSTGCDLVMIARGALGNPWIFREAVALYEGHPKPERPQVDEIKATIKKHIELALSAKGEYAAVRELRKHVAWYTKGISGAAEFRRRANNASTAEQLLEIVDGLGLRAHPYNDIIPKEI